MRKSLIAIAVLGLTACCVLSWMMRHLVDLECERREPPFLPALRVQFGARLVQPLRLREEVAAGGRRWIATLHVAAETDAARLAESVGREVWLHAHRAEQVPSEVLVRVHQEAAGPATTISVPFSQPLR